MSIIKVTVDDQALYLTESPVVAAQGVNENYFQFTLSEDWTGFGAVALFWKEGNETDVYESVVDGTGKALVPHEVTDSQGRICVGLAGTKGNIIHTSEVLKYKVVKGKYTAGQSSEPPTPGIYEQMLSLAGQMSDQFRQVVEEQNEAIEDLQSDQAALRSELTAQQTTFQNTISGQMNSFIAGQSGDYGATVLWDMDTEGDHNGALGQDTVLTLRENVENFDFIEIWAFNNDVDDSVFIPVEKLSGVGTAVKSANIGLGTTKLRIVETRLTAQYSEMTIAHQFIFTFDTAHAATRITQDNKSTYISQFGISRVIGRKMVQNAELVDIRVGENGTTYQTAGAAVRGQITETKALIPAIDASLATAGRAADAKATGDAIAEVNGRLTELGTDLKITVPISQGMVSDTVGAVPAPITENYDTRIHTDSIPREESVNWTVSVAEGYRVRILRLTAEGKVATAFWRSGENNEITTSPYAIIIVAGLDGEVTLSPADFWNIVTITNLPTKVDGKLEDYARASDLQSVSESALKTADIAPFWGQIKNFAVANIENICWSWWMYPQVIHEAIFRNRMYFGFVNTVGEAGIASIDLDDTNKREQVALWMPGADDHNGMAIWQNPSTGRMYAFGTTHNNDSYVRCFLSQRTRSGRYWQELVNIDFGKPVTYAQIHFDTTNSRIALFTRYNVTAWAVKFSDDAGGQTWTGDVKKVVLAPNIQYYCLFRETDTPNLIRIIMYSNPTWTPNDTNIRMGFVNIATGNIYNADGATVLGTIGDGVLYSDFDIVVPAAVGKKNRLLDVVSGSATNRIFILYADFTDETDAQYHCYYNGTIVDIAACGTPFYTPSIYVGGAVFNPKNKDEIYISRMDGRTDKIEKYAYASGQYTLSEVITTSNRADVLSRTIRPIIDKDGKILIYQRGRVNLTNFNQYNTDADFHVIE